MKFVISVIVDVETRNDALTIAEAIAEHDFGDAGEIIQVDDPVEIADEDDDDDDD